MSQTQPFPAYNCFVNEYLIEATAYRIPSAGHAVTPASVPSSATPAASVAPQPSTSGAATQEQQLQELTRTPGLSYEEYQRRYRLIMGQ
ncbi:hypothetical protein [Pseudomonas fluvialis]|nr:hypothetical protein [Pseudomonas pharmacofabricae]